MFGLKDSRKRKKIVKKNNFLIFSFTIKNAKKVKYNYNYLKIYIFLNDLIYI